MSPLPWSRRDFLASAGATAAALAVGCRPGAAPNASPAASPAADKLGALGVGLFTLPKSLGEDLDGTLAMMAGLGYREVELFGPYPFSVQSVRDQWAQVGKMLGFTGSGYFGLTAAQFRARLDAHGLVAPSAHIDLETLRDRTEQVGEAARILGHQYVGIATIPEDRRGSLDDWRRMADELNAIGARARPLGFKVLYHHHGEGWAPVDGQVPARVVFDRLDPSLVSLEMDVFWTVASGGDPVELLDAYPKLYRLMHVKDMSRQVRFAHGGDMQDLISLGAAMTPAGTGVLDLPRILGHAKRNGVEHFYVEQDLAANPPEQLGASIRNLRAMTLVV